MASTTTFASDIILKARESKVVAGDTVHCEPNPPRYRCEVVVEDARVLLRLVDENGSMTEVLSETYTAMDPLGIQNATGRVSSARNDLQFKRVCY